MEIEIVPILTRLENLNFEVPIKLEKTLGFSIRHFLFKPVRYEYLMKVDNKKFTFDTIKQLQEFIYNSTYENYSFRGVIFYCGFFVESKFNCESILDLNREVKYILHSDTINCKKPSIENKRVFTKRIRDWNEQQHLEDSVPIWCDVDDFKLKPIEIIGEVVCVTTKEFKEELERLNNLPQSEAKLTFFARIRKFIGL